MAGQLGPGDRIETRCNRCNDITGHIIVAMVDGAIVKVECRACGSVHKYYPPAGTAKKTRKSSSISTSAKPSKSKEALSKIQAANDEEEVWHRKLNLATAKPVPYSMTAFFATGDVLDHAKFGLGVVQEILPPDKIRVLFREGLKMLRCAGKRS